MNSQLGNIPCVCSHKLLDHFEIEYRKRESNWPCKICVNTDGGCLDYKQMDNLEYLEYLDKKKGLLK